MRYKCSLNDCACVCPSSVSGPRQQLGLRGEQLLVQRREQWVSSERVTLTEPAQLLHVHTAQRTQLCHLLVQLQGGHRHFYTLHGSKEGAGQLTGFAFLLANQRAKENVSASKLRHVPCALDFLGCLGVECVWVLTPRFFALAEPCLYPPDMDGLHRKKKKSEDSFFFITLQLCELCLFMWSVQGPTFIFRSQLFWGCLTALMLKKEKTHIIFLILSIAAAPLFMVCLRVPASLMPLFQPAQSFLIGQLSQAWAGTLVACFCISSVTMFATKAVLGVLLRAGTA